MSGIGALVVWYLRKSMPESPRWLESKRRFAQAEELMTIIEAESAGLGLPPIPKEATTIVNNLNVLDLFGNAATTSAGRFDRAHRHQHTDLWLCDLVADLFRSSRTYVDPIFLIHLDDFFGRANWLRDRCVCGGSSRSAPNNHRGLSTGDCLWRTLSEYVAPAASRPYWILLVAGDLCARRTALRGLYT